MERGRQLYLLASLPSQLWMFPRIKKKVRTILHRIDAKNNEKTMMIMTSDHYSWQNGRKRYQNSSGCCLLRRSASKYLVTN